MARRIFFRRLSGYRQDFESNPSRGEFVIIFNSTTKYAYLVVILVRFTFAILCSHRIIFLFVYSDNLMSSES